MINIKRWIVFVGSTTDSSGAPWRDRRMGLWRGVEGRGGEGGWRRIINYICHQETGHTTATLLTTIISATDNKLSNNKLYSAALKSQSNTKQSSK